MTALDNGMRVVSRECDSDTVSLGVYIHSGSRFETPENNGAAHFLEHMAFKGTVKRTARALDEVVEQMGGRMHAYTARAYTSYYIQVLKKDAAEAVDLISDMVQNPILDPTAMDLERGVILDEMDSVNNIMDEYIYDHLHSVAYQGTGLGLTILGPESNIRSLTPDHLRDYIKTHYKGPHMCLVGAGGISHNDLSKLASTNFSNLSSEARPSLPPAHFTGGDVRIRNDSNPYAHIAIAAECAGMMSEDWHAIHVASQLVGEWDRSHGTGVNTSSKLARTLQEYGSASYFRSMVVPFSDTALFSNYMVCDKTKIDDAVYALQQEWMRLCMMVTEEEVTRAKNTVLSKSLAMLDGHDSYMDWLGRTTLEYGRPMSVEEMVQHTNEVSAKKVQEVMHKYLYDQDVAVVGVGSVEGMPDYNRIRSGMLWKRF